MTVFWTVLGDVYRSSLFIQVRIYDAMADRADALRCPDSGSHFVIHLRHLGFTVWLWYGTSCLTALRFHIEVIFVI